jgi:vitamin B12 transporter
VIESLDISGGFVFEHWRWLSSMPPLVQSAEEEMDADGPEMVDFLLGPRFGALYRVTPGLALTAAASRRLRSPTWHQLMRPVHDGSVLTIANEGLRAQTVTGGELGPAIATSTFEARAVAYYNRIDAPITAVAIDNTLRETANLGRAHEAGVDAAASWRLAKPWLAGVGYTYTATRISDGGAYAELAGNQLAQTPRHRATAMLSFDEPRVATITGAVRYAGSRFTDARNTEALAPFTVIDAMATRQLTHGLAGFVAVENVLDRRYVTNVAAIDSIGAPRMVHVGVRLDSARW